MRTGLRGLRREATNPGDPTLGVARHVVCIEGRWMDIVSGPPDVVSGPPLGSAVRLARPVPVVFGPSSHQVLGLHHAPDPAVATASGVVLCNPLGYEAMCTHRAYRHLAQRLAAAGIHALRFDYHGTGDSSGDATEPSRVRAWLDGIGAAIDELRAISGAPSITLFGVRFGATLAAQVAAERRDVRGLVLWAPCASGRSYMRELRAFRLLKEGHSTARSDDKEEIAGYLFEPSTVADISAVDVFSGGQRLAERALVLARGDVASGEGRVAEHLAKTGTTTLFRKDSGYALMMRDPQETKVPGESLDGIVSWVREAPELPSEAAARIKPRSSVLAAVARGGTLAVREEALHFGRDGRLFGILTEPAAETPASRAAPAIVFLSVGANHRVGPNRMYVTLARELAGLGYTALRFDLAGIGDSPAPDEANENRLYSKASVDDVREAVTFLTSGREGRRVILVGVCSGAYVAFHTALEDARVSGQVLINPQTFEWGEGDSLEIAVRKSRKSTRYYLSALVEREVWASALRGGVDVKSVAATLKERLFQRTKDGLAVVRARLRGEPPPRTSVETAFAGMSDRGVESLLVFSSTDGGIDMIESHLGLEGSKVKGRKNIRFSIIDDADHTFTPAKSQRELASVVRSFIQGVFGISSPGVTAVRGLDSGVSAAARSAVGLHVITIGGAPRPSKPPTGQGVRG